MTYEEALRHLANPRVVAQVFDKKTREAIRTVVRENKDIIGDTDYREKKEPEEDDDI